MISLLAHSLFSSLQGASVRITRIDFQRDVPRANPDNPQVVIKCSKLNIMFLHWVHVNAVNNGL